MGSMVYWTRDSNGTVAPFDLELEEFCRLCGNKARTNGDDLCDSCQEKVTDEMVKSLIPKNSKVHCMKCFRHINACTCEPAQKMKELQA